MRIMPITTMMATTMDIMTIQATFIIIFSLPIIADTPTLIESSKEATFDQTIVIIVLMSIIVQMTGTESTAMLNPILLSIITTMKPPITVKTIITIEEIPLACINPIERLQPIEIQTHIDTTIATIIKKITLVIIL
jgi:hypothetical protein